MYLDGDIDFLGRGVGYLCSSLDRLEHFGHYYWSERIKELFYYCRGKKFINLKFYLNVHKERNKSHHTSYVREDCPWVSP